jgi:hypothetical protein
MRGTASSDAPEGEAAPLRALCGAMGDRARNCGLSIVKGKIFPLGCQVMTAVGGCHKNQPLIQRKRHHQIIHAARGEFFGYVNAPQWVSTTLRVSGCRGFRRSHRNFRHFAPLGLLYGDHSLPISFNGLPIQSCDKPR